MSNRNQVVGDQVVTSPEVRGLRVDLGAVEFPYVLCAGPALLRGVNIQVDTSAHTVSLGYGSTVIDQIPPQMVAGTWLPFGDVYYPGGIVLVGDNAMTGIVAFKYIPLG